jgi:hypothetical protein
MRAEKIKVENNNEIILSDKNSLMIWIPGCLAELGPRNDGENTNFAI